MSTSFDTAPYAALYQATALEVIQKVPVLCAFNLYVCICYWQGYTQRDILEVLVILHLVLLLWVGFINKSVCLYFCLHIYRNMICIPLPQTQNVKMAFVHLCVCLCVPAPLLCMSCDAWKDEPCRARQKERRRRREMWRDVESVKGW